MISAGYYQGVESCCLILMILIQFSIQFSLQDLIFRWLADTWQAAHFAKSDAVKVHWTPNRSALVTFRRGLSPIEAEEYEFDLRWQC